MDETDGFIVIRSWMIELGLSGNELIVFALINGFSMDGKSTFNGGLEYLCNQTGIARRTAINCLKRLTEAGMIKKTSVKKNGVDYSAYSVSKQACKKCTGEKNALVHKVHSGSEKIALAGSEKIAPKKKDIKEKESKGISPPISPPRGGCKPPKKSSYSPEWLISEGVSPDVAGAFASVRKAKKAPLSKLAVDGFKREALKAGISLEDAVRFSAERGYQGFQADWYAKTNPAPKKMSLEEAIEARHAERDRMTINVNAKEVCCEQVTC